MTQQQNHSERRRFTRVCFDAIATISDSRSQWKSEVIDISLKGILIRQPDNWKHKLDERFQISIHLNDQTTILMEARVAHTKNNTIGFVCEEIDIESIGHLRRLIEHNTEDETLIYRELNRLRQD